MHSVLYSGSCRASFSGIRGILRNPRNSADHTSELNHPRAILICSGIRRNPEFRPEFRMEGPLTWYSATCNKHSQRRHTKNRCQRWHSERTATSRYCCRHCCQCLSNGSSGRAGVAACGGGSGNSSRGGSGGGSSAILFLVVVIILLLFCCLSPRRHRRRSSSPVAIVVVVVSRRAAAHRAVAVSYVTTAHARNTTPCIMMWWRKTWERIPQFFSHPFSF